MNIVSTNRLYEPMFEDSKHPEKVDVSLSILLEVTLNIEKPMGKEL